ncbi:MAG: prolyl oligopeptidase family serine peptidase [Puniceicoccaceae bacterium]
MRKLQSPFIIALLLATPVLPVLQGASLGQVWPYPETPAREVVHQYGPVKLSDPFSWLEEDETEEAEAWFRSQDAFTRSSIADMPLRQELFERIKSIDEAKTVQIYSFNRRGERYFFLKREVGEEVGSLYYRDGIHGEANLILDPVKFTNGEGVHSIEYYTPSPDGRLVAVGIAEGGSEIPNMHILRVDSGEQLSDVIRRVRGSPSWLEDGSGFYYTQMRPEDPSLSQVDRFKLNRSKFHDLGTDPAIDPIIVSHEVNPTPGLTDVDSPYVLQVAETPYTVAYISHGVDRAITLFYAIDFDPTKPTEVEWIQICEKDDRIENLTIHKDSIFLISTKDAPRGKILKGDLSNYSRDDLELLLPQSEDVLMSIDVAGDHLYLSAMQGGIDKLMTLDLNNSVSGMQEIQLPLIGRVTFLRNDYRESDFYISLMSWTQSSAYYRYDPSDNSIELSPLRPLGPFDSPEGLVAKRVMVESHDGTQVPLTIIHSEDVVMDGTNPTILYGYGAYGSSMRPAYGPIRLAWLERGGVYCVAHVRGGGEFGKSWHKGGHRETKRNSWLDFNACAEYLIENEYTSSANLAAMGGSMGGVLVGRAMTSRPELYGAIVSGVGNHNPVRNHKRANGPANYPEYGNPLDPEEFPYVLAMDSYFAVQDDVAYPPMLLTCGYNDSRVDPWMPGKMAARLQQANPQGGPHLLRVGFEAGHGGVARSDIWEEIADEYTFLLWAIGGSSHGK